VRRVAQHARRALATNEDLHGRLRRVEAEALRLQTVRRDFVANISHELRTPLASIKLLVETLAGGALEDEAVAGEFIRKIGQETDHLIAMTQELLDLARLEAEPALKPTAVNAVALISHVLQRMRELARARRVTLEVDHAPDLPAVWADPDQVSRVLVNLLHNAITFSPEDGAVTVSSRVEPGVVAISVADRGAGIPPGEEVRIFERFYKVDAARHGAGTGLGLSIARHIVEALGGQIWARNRADGGACVTFTLRIARPSTPSTGEGTGQDLTPKFGTT
jgi:two-component system phosphate regulon sensor histidine kinase PhoR